MSTAIYANISDRARRFCYVLIRVEGEGHSIIGNEVSIMDVSGSLADPLQKSS